jgi:hypothetical protein
VANAVAALIVALEWSVHAHRNAGDAATTAAEAHRRAADLYRGLGQVDRAAVHEERAAESARVAREHGEWAANDLDAIEQLRPAHPST